MHSSRACPAIRGFTKAWTSPAAELASILATRTGVLPPRMVGVIEGLAQDWRKLLAAIRPRRHHA
jgi:hypothetical protein